MALVLESGQLESGSSSSGSEDEEERAAYSKLLTPAQWLYCGVALLVELYLIYVWNVSYMAKMSVCVYGIAHLMLVSLYPRSGDAAVAQQPAALVATAPGTQKVRNYYLDNVKILCTELVLIHHISICFGGDGGVSWAIRVGTFQSGDFDWAAENSFAAYMNHFILTPNQCFFMCLLFFISGIFTPSSLERKGAPEFMRDKLKRLGLPLFITFFVATPVLTGTWGIVFIGDRFWDYAVPQSSVTWFLAALIIFNLAYVVVPFPQVTIRMPSLWQLIIICAMLGAIQGYVKALGYWAGWLYMAGPQIQGGYPFDVAFFAAGCIAKRSGWLEAVSTLSCVQYWSARAIAIVFVVAGFPLSCPSEDCDKWLDLCMKVAEGAWWGVVSITLSVSVLHFFAMHTNRPSPFSTFCGEAQYGVYVLQTIIIPCVMWTYVRVLEAAGHRLYFVYTDNTPSSKTQISTGLLVGGWFYTVILVTLISWPLAYYFRKLPGVRNVL